MCLFGLVWGDDARGETGRDCKGPFHSVAGQGPVWMGEDKGIAIRGVVLFQEQRARPALLFP